MVGITRRRPKLRITKLDVERARKGFQESLRRTKIARAKLQRGLEEVEQRRKKLAPRIQKLSERADTFTKTIEEEGGFTGFGKSRPVKRKREEFFRIFD